MRMELPLRFGQRVKERRKVLGLSQDALADKCGMHRTYIGSIERGERNITLINADRIAKSLDIELSELVK